MPELILDEPKEDPRLVLDEPASPRYGSGLSPEFPDLPGFELSKELRERTENSLYYSTQYGIPPEMAFDMEPELKEQAEKLDLMSDIEKAIYETPENIKIGTLAFTSGELFNIKKYGMMFSGGGIFPDTMVKHQFEPIKPMKREDLPNIPGMIRPTTKDWPTGTLAEAFGLVTRLPHVGGAIVQSKVQELVDAQDKITIKNAPFTQKWRTLTQSGIPSMGIALGTALLTGDPIIALAFLGMSEEGSSFQTQLEGGASIMKASVISSLSGAAEIGGEMLVFPKIFKGVKEGFSLREAFTSILENATQEGITGFNQRFLEVFGLETTKGMDAEQAAIKALNEGVKAIPENAWVGGASAGGAVVLRGGFDIAVAAKEAVSKTGAEAVAKPIAIEKAPTEAIPALVSPVEEITAPEALITPVAEDLAPAEAVKGEVKPKYDIGTEIFYTRDTGQMISGRIVDVSPIVASETQPADYLYTISPNENPQKTIQVYESIANIKPTSAPMPAEAGGGVTEAEVKVVEEPERKVSRAAQRIQEEAIAKDLTESLGELPTYETMPMKEQARMAAEEINRDYENAKQMAYGKVAPPSGLRPASIYRAVAIVAEKEGDVETLRNLAIVHPQVSLELTAMGQAIKAADVGISRVNPVKAIQDIQKTREKAVQRKGKIKDVKKQVKTWAKEAKTEIRKQTTHRQSWSEFVESIRC